MCVKILLPIFVVQSSFLLDAWESKKCAVTDLRSLPKRITSFAVASVQYLLLLLSISILSNCLSFPLADLKVYCFRVIFESCLDRYIVLNHQPLFHPDATFVGFTRCVLSNEVTFRVYTRSKLSVEIARDDRSMFFTVIPDAFSTFSMCTSAHP